MIINPSAHTMIPRRNVYRRQAAFRGKRTLSLPGGRLLWIGTAKVLAISVCLCFVATAFLNRSAAKLSTEIEAVTASTTELHRVNTLLNEQTKQLFSTETIGGLANDQLAIHLPVPGSGQYRVFRKSSGMFY
jgi:hypothetical protein